METLRNPRTISLLLALLFVSLVSLGNIRAHAKEEKLQVCLSMQNNLRDKTLGVAAGNSAAKAIYVYDFTDSRELFGVNQNTPLALASLTKLMTVRLAAPTIALGQPYTITKTDVIPDGTATGFAPGDVYAPLDIVRAALIESSNNAAAMLAHSTGLPENEFIANMNADAQKLGLTSLSYESVTGLDLDDTHASAFGSAHDIVTLLYQDYLDYPDLFAESTHPSAILRSTTGKTIPIQNTDLAIPYLPLLIASKTGYTDIAGGNLAVLWKAKNGHTIGAAVLGSSQYGRFTDMTSLATASEPYLDGLGSFPNLCQ